MNTRCSRLKKASKKAATYASTAATGAWSVMDVVGMFVKIPALIKWCVIALVGLIAGCIGCCKGMNEADQQQQAVNPVAQPMALAEETHQIHRELDELKQSLAYHCQQNNDLKDEAKHVVNTWVEKRKEGKSSRDGMFAVSMTPPQKDRSIVRVWHDKTAPRSHL
jgi:regulator of replication initiation timing